jgi:hypothetical protein
MSRFTSDNINVGLASTFNQHSPAFNQALNAKTTPIQTKFIVTTDKSLPNDKAVTINLKKGDILQGVSTSKWGTPENDAGGYGLTFTDKAGNKFSISTGGRTDIPFYKELDSTIVTDDQKEQQSANAQQPFLEKHKNHLLLLLAVVAGYFAYKKFKK